MASSRTTRLAWSRGHAIDALETSHSARVVVEMLAGAAKKLRMSLVAEGIEQQSQLARLGEIGVEHGQGYLFGRPVPVASLVSDLLQRQGRPGSSQSRADDTAV